LLLEGISVPFHATPHPLCSTTRNLTLQPLPELSNEQRELGAALERGDPIPPASTQSSSNDGQPEDAADAVPGAAPAGRRRPLGLLSGNPTKLLWPLGAEEEDEGAEPEMDENGEPLPKPSAPERFREVHRLAYIVNGAAGWASGGSV
jgi:hypothetical protein